MTQSHLKRLLSIDLPWSSNGWVGAAIAEHDGQMTRVRAASCKPRNLPLEDEGSECKSFIALGARSDTIMDVDAKPDDPKVNPVNRRRFIEGFYGGLLDVAGKLGFDGLPPSTIDIASIDVPFVPSRITEKCRAASAKLSARRPVERALDQKVKISGDGWSFNFANPQSGMMFGWRPGYAIAELVQRVFGAASVVESFPQLSIGALTEIPDGPTIPCITSLSAHKGSVASGRVGREAVSVRIARWLRTEPQWPGGDLHSPGAADALDALLGLLPLLAMTHEGVSLGDLRCGRAIMWRNAAPDELQVPKKRGKKGKKIVSGCRDWIDDKPIIVPGVNDQGILALDAKGWV